MDTDLDFSLDRSVGIAVESGTAVDEMVSEADHMVLVPGPTGYFSPSNHLLLRFITAEYCNYLFVDHKFLENNLNIVVINRYSWE